jgi:hypothetical protein
VAAEALVRVGVESLPELRRNPGSFCGDPFPASFLKHADEQTLVGLAAVSRAIHTRGLQTTNFHDWGVLAAPRFLGRPAMAAQLQRFQAEGAWGVSPHLIPHRSLHSISGTVSQALKIHGPNYGVGGGPAAAAEALLAATAMLEGKRLPGVWVVLTCLDPDNPPDDTGRPRPGTMCVGLALALAPVRANASRARLRVVSGGPETTKSAGRNAPPASGAGFDLLRLEALLNLLHASPGEARVAETLCPGARLELVRPATGGGPHFGRLWNQTSDSDCGHVALADC